MPAKSGKQFRFMAMIEAKSGKGSKSDSGIGPSPEVAEEMVKKTPPSKRSLFMKKDKKKGLLK